MTTAGIFRELLHYINPDIICIIMEFAERNLMDYKFPIPYWECYFEYKSFNKFMVNKFPIPYLDYRRIKNKLFDMTIGDFPPIQFHFNG